MILDEQGNRRAVELAREMVRIEKKQERERTQQAIKEFKSKVLGTWEALEVVGLELGKALGNVFRKES